MLQIKKMTEVEIDEVAEIAAEVFVRPWTKQGFADALPMENACFLVAVEQDKVLGYCGIYMALDEGEIINVAVKPEYQKQGIADLLLKSLLAEGKKCGITRFFLEVRVSNEAAIHLYEKNGFIKQGIRKDFYKEIHEDAYVMNRIDEMEEEVNPC